MKRSLFGVLGLGLTLALFVAACGGDDDSATTPSNDQVLSQVKQALLDKNGWDPSTVEITLDSVESSKYAKGAVRDVPAGGGGLWFAALVDGKWQIVWDGNGVIDCPSLDPYPDFPASMIAQCVKPDGTMMPR